jgi:hypothetical protein
MDKIIDGSRRAVNPALLASRAAGGLGILPKDRPAASGVASSSSAVEIIDRKTGEISVFDPASDVRLKRYVRQSAARRLLPSHRVSWCLRRNRDHEQTAVLKNQEGKCHFGGLISCGRVWECPVCASKVSQRRRNELSSALDQHRAQGGALLLVTYTFSHDREDDLADLLIRQNKAIAAVRASREFKSIRAAHGLIGTVRALEITHGQANGWHPHQHEIWFLEKQDAFTIQAIKTRLFRVWRDQCIKKGLGEPSSERGIDVRDGSHASTYVSKWGIEDEITKANQKTGKQGSRNPFQLLDDYIEDDKQAGALFIEYAKAFKGKRQLCWSKGLKKRFQVQDKTDEELAVEQETGSDILGLLSVEEWRFILKNRNRKTDHRPVLLAHAERGGWGAVREYLQALGFALALDISPGLSP